MMYLVINNDLPPEAWALITLGVTAIIRWIERGLLIRKQKKRERVLLEDIKKLERQNGVMKTNQSSQ